MGWVFSLSYRMAGKLRPSVLRKRAQGLPIIGLSLAVAILIVVLSVVNGFEVAMRERVLALFPHAVIVNAVGAPLTEPQMLRISQTPGVVGVAPIAEISAVLVANGEHQAALVTAIDPIEEQKVNAVPDFMVSGHWSMLEAVPFGVVLSAHLAEKLGLITGGRVTIMLPVVEFSLIGMKTRSKRFTVVGTFDTDSDLDKSVVYIGRTAARALLSDRYLEGLRLKVNDLFDSQQILEQIYIANLDQPIRGSTWMSRHGNLYAAIGLQKSIMFVLLGLLIAVAAFNVTSQLVIFVEEHRADVAILKTLGATPGEIRSVFVAQGLGLGVLGTVIGLMIGYLGCDALQLVLNAASEAFGWAVLEQYFVQYLPIDRQVTDFLIVSLMSLLMCVLASLYPAHRAAQMMITEGLNDGG